jgi:F-type H+-transporting ATPase subunit alpha
MNSTKDFIVEQLKEQIAGFKANLKEETTGRVVEIGDGIAKIDGLSDVMMSEMLEFKTRTDADLSPTHADKTRTDADNAVYGVALNLEEDRVGAIILGDSAKIKEGDEVRCLKKILEVPVGEGVIGRVLDPLGAPLDGKGEIQAEKFYHQRKSQTAASDRD